MTGYHRHFHPGGRRRFLSRFHGAVVLALSLLLLFTARAHAQGLSGSADLQQNSTETVTSGLKAARDRFHQNYFLRLEKKITPMLSYGLYLRTTLADTKDKDIFSVVKERSTRDLEPMIDLLFQSPVYSLNMGYRHQESRQELRPEGTSSELSTGYFYSRFDVKPIDLPDLSLQFDRKDEKDDQDRIDSVIATYSGTSSYTLTWKNINTGYNVRYVRKVAETQLAVVNKNIDELLTGQYTLGYSKSFWSGRLRLSSAYRGNYTRNINEVFSSTGGTVLRERTPFQGLSGRGTGTGPDENVQTLMEDPALIDDIRNVPTALDIGTDRYINIGIQLISSVQPVSRLYIYVRSDIALTVPSNWGLYISGDNITWVLAPAVIQSATPAVFDALNDIYRYELVFSSAVSAPYYKVINREVVNAPRLSNVFVTEIEAYGTEEISVGGSLRQESVLLNQGLVFTAGLRALPRLDLSFNYSINRSDQEPDSIIASAGGLFQNIFSRTSPPDDDKHISDASRLYGVSANWKTHRLLTAVFRVQRSESFDNQDTRDFASNSYSASLSSAPLPTLDLNLSVNRSDAYSFDEHTGTNHLARFSAGARLYRDVNMLMDAGYSHNKSVQSGLETSSFFVSTHLQSRLTPKLSGNLAYRFNSSESGAKALDSHEGNIIFSYRPGRLVNMTASLRAFSSDEERTLQGAFSLDWRPIRALSLTGRFDRSATRPGPMDSYGFNTALRWQIFRFMDLQLNYNYRSSEDTVSKTAVTFIGGKLNCSF